MASRLENVCVLFFCSPSSNEEQQRNLATFIHNCKDNWKCPICFDIFIDPVIIECKHEFCDFCIQKSFDVKKKCPSCRHKVNNPVIRNRNLGSCIDSFCQNVMDENARTTRNKKVEERRLEVEVYQKSAGNSFVFFVGKAVNT